METENEQRIGISFANLEANFYQQLIPLRNPEYVHNLLQVVGASIDQGSAIGWCPALEIFVAFCDGVIVKMDRSAVPGIYG